MQRGICRRLVRLRLLKTNPTEWIEGRLGRQDTEIRQADYLTREVLTKLLTAAERVCAREYPNILVMATAGLRVGEAVALQAGELDVPGLQIHTRRTARRGYVSSPKSGKAGVPFLTFSRQLRHASISTTADLYTHAVPGSNRAAAEALGAILTSNQTQPPRNLTS